jgi:thymidylate synthase
MHPTHRRIFIGCALAHHLPVNTVEIFFIFHDIFIYFHEKFDAIKRILFGESISRRGTACRAPTVNAVHVNCVIVAKVCRIGLFSYKKSRYGALKRTLNIVEFSHRVRIFAYHLSVNAIEIFFIFHDVFIYFHQKFDALKRIQNLWKYQKHAVPRYGALKNAP